MNKNKPLCNIDVVFCKLGFRGVFRFFVRNLLHTISFNNSKIGLKSTPILNQLICSQVPGLQ